MPYRVPRLCTYGSDKGFTHSNSSSCPVPVPFGPLAPATGGGSSMWMGGQNGSRLVVPGGRLYHIGPRAKQNRGPSAPASDVMRRQRSPASGDGTPNAAGGVFRSCMAPTDTENGRKGDVCRRNRKKRPCQAASQVPTVSSRVLVSINGIIVARLCRSGKWVVRLRVLQTQ